MIAIPVIATWKPNATYWELTFAVNCPSCGARHRHGSGDDPTGPDAILGVRVAHCATHHKPRPGCSPERDAGGRQMCTVEHIGGQYALRPATHLDLLQGRIEDALRRRADRPLNDALRDLIALAKAHEFYATTPALRGLVAQLEANR